MKRVRNARIVARINAPRLITSWRARVRLMGSLGVGTPSASRSRFYAGSVSSRDWFQLYATGLLIATLIEGRRKQLAARWSRLIGGGRNSWECTFGFRFYDYSFRGNSFYSIIVLKVYDDLFIVYSKDKFLFEDRRVIGKNNFGSIISQYFIKIERKIILKILN